MLSRRNSVERASRNRFVNSFLFVVLFCVCLFFVFVLFVVLFCLFLSEENDLKFL